ncbi:MAG: flagellar hook assembly protein FlgD [Methylotenera sp.]|jgi:flagellar basal-body rod modification protein FlgD|uniref:flagellar hook assembly protein FlgD n=1 Tax=Methylotenera sp. TaxID=2051956 RepID=UPI002722B65C|nr:flagellar hook assembly protein FlgD [Methylotenera sp.]MDO9151659.1 flagellar hook assembly protein FlgD [Methylotenera sp.]
MTTVNAANTPSQALLDAMNTKKSSTASVDEAQNRFMTLLVTQMRNQDPLNPMDNAQVTSQMAQLSTVTGIDKLNNTLETLINNVQMGQSYQASNLIGRSVLTPGDTIQTSGEAGYFGIELPIGADKVKVNIKDGSGATIRTIELGKQDAGTIPLTWDGFKDDGTTAPAGNYKFEVEATIGSNTAAATTLSFAKVLSISNYSTGVKLNLSNLMTVDTTAVKEIF